LFVRSKNFGENFFVDKKRFIGETTDFYFSKIKKYLLNAYNMRVQIKSWAGKALETVNYCAFLKRRLIGAR
jgi:hypothetical protein